jgi:O-antigen ligase
LVNEVRVAFPSSGAALSRGTVVVDNPMRKLSIFMLLLFMYVTQARLLEVVYIPSLAFILAILALIGATLGGDMAGTVKSRTGLLLIGFTLWSIASVPFGVWPGGSVGVLKDTWNKTAMVFFMVGAVLLMWRECKTAFYTMAAATATIVVLSFKFANMSSGRLAFGYGTLGNPNDFAAYLLVGAPFCVYAMLRARPFMRAVWATTLLLLLVQFMKTGSRGGMVALAVLVVYMFWKSSMMWKVAMVLCLMLALAAAPLVLPRSVLNRYATMLGGSGAEDEESRQGEFAEASTESRTQLFLLSLELTARNPLLGVGIGMFNVAAANAMKAEGKRGTYMQTHNLYTQVSSETGLPGLALYLAALWHSIASLRFVRKNGGAVNPDFVRMANCVHASWILFLATGMFASVAYHIPVAFLLGFSYALKNTLTCEMVAVRVRQPAAAPPRGRFAAPQPVLR